SDKGALSRSSRCNRRKWSSWSLSPLRCRVDRMPEDASECRRGVGTPIHGDDDRRVIRLPSGADDFIPHYPISAPVVKPTLSFEHAVASCSTVSPTAAWTENPNAPSGWWRQP